MERQLVEQPKDSLDVIVRYFDGLADGDIGRPYYVATCDPIGLVTDGVTLDELFAHLHDAIALALDEADPVTSYGVVPIPRITIHTD
jgi:predicted RNase H-like HicB family nuclease